MREAEMCGRIGIIDEKWDGGRGKQAERWKKVVRKRQSRDGEKNKGSQTKCQRHSRRLSKFVGSTRGVGLKVSDWCGRNGKQDHSNDNLIPGRKEKSKKKKNSRIGGF